MELLIEIFIFIIGCCLGSFYACMGYRIPNKINTIKPSSFCPNCKKPLKWYMNIPLFSYIFLKGKCHYCKEKIGISYFLIELFTGLSFLISYILYGFTINFFILIILFSILSVTLISDIKYYYISDRVIIISVIAMYIIHFIFEKENFDILRYTITALLMFLIMFLIKILGDKIFKKESLGGGDIKLMSIVGLTFGDILMSFVSLFISSVLALIISLILNKNKDNIIPFGPFILIGTIIVYIYYVIYGINFLIL